MGNCAGHSSDDSTRPVDVAADALDMTQAECCIRIAMLLRNFSKLRSEKLMYALAVELAVDAQRPQPLIDLNHQLADGGTLLTQLIVTLPEHTCVPLGASDFVRRQKLHAYGVFSPVQFHLLNLVRSADVSLPSKNGETPLALLCRLAVPQSISAWCHRMAEALLQAGADADCRDKDGWAPLLAWTWDANETACGPLLLLRHAADIDAQTFDNGSTMLHLLVRNARIRKKKMLPALRKLAESGYLALADFTLLNNAGETALDLARALVSERPRDAVALEVLNTLQTQSQMWRDVVRPVAFIFLTDGGLVSDVAAIVLAYVDGAQRPSERDAVEDDEEKQQAQ